jgi:hypothetical protein
MACPSILYCGFDFFRQPFTLHVWERLPPPWPAIAADRRSVMFSSSSVMLADYSSMNWCTSTSSSLSIFYKEKNKANHSIEQW